MADGERRDDAPVDAPPAVSPKPRPQLIPQPPELREATITGSFTDGLQVISRTSAGLHILPGRVDGEDGEKSRKYLLPFAEVRLGGGKMAEMDPDDEGRDPPTILTATLSLENMAFMVYDLMRDLRGLCSETSSIVGGKLAVDPTRMAHVRYFVAHIEKQARACRVELDKAFGEPRPTGQRDDPS